MKMKFTKGLLTGSLIGAVVGMRMLQNRNSTNQQQQTGGNTGKVEEATIIIDDNLR